MLILFINFTIVIKIIKYKLLNLQKYSIEKRHTVNYYKKFKLLFYVMVCKLPMTFKIIGNQLKANKTNF